ncbi:MAG: hypothetical protein A2X59_00085 [Nitrospirae bacterium GWC2_42_7]|nr:MAG: hypothetical protein A2X59_00085 [Nitrospirae bacterium GWC2_42_7]
MTYPKQAFSKTIREKLESAYKEFLCLKIGRALNLTQHQSCDLEKLIESILTLMNSKNINMTYSDHKKAFSRAVSDAMLYDKQALAKARIAKVYPKLSKEIDALSFNAQFEFPEMMREFLPQYAKIANNTLRRRIRAELLKNIHIHQQSCVHEFNQESQTCIKCGFKRQ